MEISENKTCNSKLTARARKNSTEQRKNNQKNLPLPRGVSLGLPCLMKQNSGHNRSLKKQFK